MRKAVTLPARRPLSDLRHRVEPDGRLSRHVLSSQVLLGFVTGAQQAQQACEAAC